MKDFFNHLWLVNKADDPHLALALTGYMNGQGLHVFPAGAAVSPTTLVGLLITTHLLSAVLSVAFADVVELKAGERVEGVVSGVTSSTVAVEVGGQTLTFEREKVRSIYFGSTPDHKRQDKPLAAQEALKALKGLDSVVQGGVTYREYSSRVLDAKVVVDRFLEKLEPADRDAALAVNRAIGYHVAASSVWNAKVRNQLYYDVDPVVYECPEARELIRQGQQDRQIGNFKLQAGLSAQKIVANFGGLPVIWRCASKETADAERRFRAR